MNYVPGFVESVLLLVVLVFATRWAGERDPRLFRVPMAVGALLVVLMAGAVATTVLGQPDVAIPLRWSAFGLVGVANLGVLAWGATRG